MATENLGVVVSFEVDGDYSAKQHTFVKSKAATTADTVTTCGAGETADGVLQDNPGAAGRAGSVALPGCITKIKLGANLAAEVEVASSATGTAVAAGAGDRILGKLFEGGNAGEKVSLHFYVGPIHP